MIYINPGTNEKYNVLRYGASAGGPKGRPKGRWREHGWFPRKVAG